MAKVRKSNNSKKKPIEQYDHKGKKRFNNPQVGLVTPETDKNTGKNTSTIRTLIHNFAIVIEVNYRRSPGSIFHVSDLPSLRAFAYYRRKFVAN